MSALLLDIASLLGCLWMLQLYDVAFNDVLGQWHCTKICRKLMQVLKKNDKMPILKQLKLKKKYLLL